MKKVLSFVVRFLGIFLILYSALAFYQTFAYLPIINQQGTLGFEAKWISGNDSANVVTYVQSNISLQKGSLSPGDTIVKINSGRLLSDDPNYSTLIGLPTIGKKVTLTVLRSHGTEDIELTIIPESITTKFIEILYWIFPGFLMLAYVIVGFWGVMRSPYSRETLAIALFCYAFGCFMYATILLPADMETFATRYLFFNEIKSMLRMFSLLASCFWLYLFATFPQEYSFYRKNKPIALLFIFLLPLLILISSLFRFPVVSVIIISIMFLNMFAGVVLLGMNSRRLQSALERRQIRLMFLGIKYGAVSVGIGWITIILTQLRLFGDSAALNSAGLIVFLLGEIGGLIIPFTFLNSFFMNRLLETETALKRRLRYIGVTLIMLVLFLSIVFFIGRTWVTMFNITDPTIIIIIVLVISFTFTPINKRILTWLDVKFYPERTKYVSSLKNFIEKIPAFPEPSDLLAGLSEWVRETTRIPRVIPVPVGGPASDIPFRPEERDSIVHRIKNGSKFFWDEIMDRVRPQVNPYEFEWAKINDISVTIPMISRGELMGMLNIGKKENETDYSAEDLDILTQVSNQTALALQNIKLQSEYLEKKRMNKELEMARRIQMQLLPQQIPEVKGLDIAGESIPCFEVAGDYFDIINLDGGNAVIVVGDVSGKGAGSAMIMANLQASIRVGVEISENFPDFIYRINNHFYSNTSPSEFITFFMGIWEPSKRKLHFINAGHNPPLLIDKNNKITRLFTSGLILGVLPGQKYKKKVITLQRGSVLVLFSDGLDEAMNPQNETFGENRIIKAVMESKDLSSAEIINNIHKRVLEFCEGRLLHDDLTLIVAKAV